MLNQKQLDFLAERLNQEPFKGKTASQIFGALYQTQSTEIVKTPKVMTLDSLLHALPVYAMARLLAWPNLSMIVPTLENNNKDQTKKLIDALTKIPGPLLSNDEAKILYEELDTDIEQTVVTYYDPLIHQVVGKQPRQPVLDAQGQQEIRNNEPVWEPLGVPNYIEQDDIEAAVKVRDA